MRSYAFSSLGNSVRVRLDVLIAASVDANLFQTGTEDAGAQVLSVLQSPTGTAEDKLRLLCTYYWHCDSIDSGELDECIAAVKRAGGNDAALNFLVRHLLYALSFHVAFLLTPLEENLRDSASNLLQRGMKKVFKAKSSKDAIVARSATKDSSLIGSFQPALDKAMSQA